LGGPEKDRLQYTVHRLTGVALSYVVQNIAVSQMKHDTEFVQVAWQCWHHVFCCPVGTLGMSTCTKLLVERTLDQRTCELVRMVASYYKDRIYQQGIWYV